MTRSIEDEARPGAEATRHAVTQTGLPEDALGYDTSDMQACALAMAEAAISGRNRAAVAAEIASVERRFGMRPTDSTSGER